ncbi:HPr kinase/phosphatase C-terminal domain-containing protein [Bosea sp. (in: a-proteobacteria)]|jgi:serine kinase of HPr protein (carbohydrate metabolism regulator)|uniref:HPr kinase/phosphorylase n=1 Tax=Bosea sp. (in: a-proteobacteria) TaxID=1871050 RepID=UPI002DDD4740|nr:HPr kinase/phosphatase C-terminal domain-containing protein [Bosea sp. (in: a-proteobacteria)]HEV2512767.1 HPr kinase/phosphatase C-terminal domain-containing protein [Bosea sp. (in: a-proteobacteria)]
MSATPLLRLHASAVVIGEAGILIRGPSGAGKSSLALALIGRAQSQGRFARLVADDRTEIAVKAGRLLAAPVPPIEGLVERRGLGLTPEPHLAVAVLRLVIDCGGEPERMPEPEALVETIAGVTLPRLALLPRAGDEGLILTALALFAGSD